MKQNRKHAPFNVVPGDTEGTTWALPEGAIARLGKGKHCNIALSPNSTYFAVGTTIGLWWYEMSSKLPIALWETERGMISAVDFSQNGEWIAVANYDGIIKVIDTQSGECIAQMKRMQEQNVYWRLNFSPDSKWITTTNHKGIVEVLDVLSGECIAQMDRGEREVMSRNPYRLEFSPNGQYVAATAGNIGTKGAQTYIWCPETGELIFRFTGINFVFSQDCRLLAAATPDESINDGDDWVAKCVSVWDIATGEHIAHFIGHNDWVDYITFSPCGEFLTSSSRDKSLRVWDLAKDVQKKVDTGFQTTRIVPFYSTEGELFAIVDGEDTIEVWNMERREKLTIPEIHPSSIDAKWFREFPQLALVNITSSKTPKLHNIHRISTLRGFNHVPDPVLFLPDGNTLASTSDPRGIVLWDVESKQARERLLKDQRITSFTVLPCGNILAAYIRDNRVWVLNVDKPEEPIAEFTDTEQEQLTWKIAFAPTGDRLAVGCRGGTIYLYDFKLKEKLKPLIGHTDFIPSVCFSPDGKRLASGSDDRIARLWDVESGEEIATLPLGKPRTLMEIAFSPCGNLIAGGMFGEIRLWCTESLTTLFTIPQPETQKPYALAFSPCGHYLASGTWWEKGMEKMAIRLWDVASGENIVTLWGHPTDIQSLTFSPDGTLLATGGFDGTILLWDMTPYL